MGILTGTSKIGSAANSGGGSITGHGSSACAVTINRATTAIAIKLFFNIFQFPFIFCPVKADIAFSGLTINYNFFNQASGTKSLVRRLSQQIAGRCLSCEEKNVLDQSRGGLPA